MWSTSTFSWSRGLITNHLLRTSADGHTLLYFVVIMSRRKGRLRHPGLSPSQQYLSLFQAIAYLALVSLASSILATASDDLTSSYMYSSMIRSLQLPATDDTDYAFSPAGDTAVLISQLLLVIAHGWFIPYCFIQFVLSCRFLSIPLSHNFHSSRKTVSGIGTDLSVFSFLLSSTPIA